MRYITILLLAFLVFNSCSNQTSDETKVEVEINKDVVADSKSTLAVEGMVCSMGCVAAIQDKLRSTPGVASAVVNYEESLASIEFDSKLVNESELIAAIGSIGDHAYSAKPLEETTVELEEEALEVTGEDSTSLE